MHRRCLPLAIVCCLTAPATASILFVDATKPAGGTGTSWPTAYSQLRDALAAAHSNPAVTEIWVADGTYVPSANWNRYDTFLLRSNLALYGGFAGNETALEQRDPVLHPAILSGDLFGDDQPGFVNVGENSIHVLAAVSVGGARLDGFVVTGGNADGSGTDDQYGGGCFLESCQVSIHGCRFERDRAAGPISRGGGLYVRSSDVDATSCAFTECSALGGGGVHSETADLALADTAFGANKATGGAGFGCDHSTAVVTGCTFTGQVATTGGGIRAQNSVIDVLACSFTGNVATTGAGIHMYGSWHSSITTGIVAQLADCSFSANSVTTGYGVAIAGGEYGATASLERCSFLANFKSASAGIGPGGALSITSGEATGPVHVTAGNCLFVDTTERQVTTLDPDHVPANMTIDFVNCTLAGPKVPSIGFRLDGGTVSIANCIVTALGSSPSIVKASGDLTVAYSAVKGGFAGTGNVAADPQFVDPAAGVAGFALKAASPCVDAGVPAVLSHGVDLLNAPRTIDGNLDGELRTDMGAIEYRSLQLTATGSLAAGSSATIGVSGSAGLDTLLFAGLGAGATFVPGIGLLMIDAGAPFVVVPLGASPVQFTAPMTTALPPGLVVHLQVVGLLGAAETPSNPASLAVP